MNYHLRADYIAVRKSEIVFPDSNVIHSLTLFFSTAAKVFIVGSNVGCPRLLLGTQI